MYAKKIWHDACIMNNRWHKASLGLIDLVILKVGGALVMMLGG
jgi:hypothetical protein